MKNLGFLFFFSFVLLISCKDKPAEVTDAANNPTEPDAVELSENQILYNEVMKIHDEVMPKMNDIHKKKTELKNMLKDNADLPAAEKTSIEQRIARLDSANESMMIWMREFEPIPDSMGEEKAKAYLEGEMEKVKKVRERILKALEE
ncbi:MAG TPA: hypothetical protein VD927_02920 [Chryseosolibacter sp.]|nr:hypothetical protein [Chryseosolibacter sp.]